MCQNRNGILQMHERLRRKITIAAAIGFAFAALNRGESLKHCTNHHNLSFWASIVILEQLNSSILMSNFSDLTFILIGILAIGIVLFLIGNYTSKRGSK